MTLGTISLVEAGGGQSLQPIFFDSISMLGDDDYPAGGTPDFSALVAAALSKEGVEVVEVVKAGPCGGYEVVYDKSADKLMMFVYPDTAGVATENTTTDLSGVTMELVVLYV